MRTAGSPQEQAQRFPYWTVQTTTFSLICGSHDCGIGGGAQLTLMESLCGSFSTKILGIFVHAREGRPSVGTLSAHIGLSLLFFQWPILRSLTTQPRSPSFTAINVESHARAKCFGSRPNTSTSNVSLAKVWWRVQLPGLVARHRQCLPGVHLTP